MTLSLNKPKLDNLAGDIWKSAERLRGKFKAYEYQSVILPIIVIRRLECVLIDWREKKAADVLKNRPKLTEKELANLVKELELNPKQCPFSNKTGWTLRRVYEEDHALLEENFRAYINGFSKNVDDIIEHFNYRATIGQMVKNNRLAPILNQYKELELGPDKLSPLEMGYIYEELLRRFSEQSGEEAGEHFTPREVIRLMVELLDIPIPDRHISIYDPACGTGGMLSVAKEHLLDRAATPQDRTKVEKFVTVHGQELSGMPRSDNGALLFLQTMLAKMKETEKGASRIAIIFNGSPLSNGDCGSGESEIRRWILENDWLDAIVMLPDQLFYNTGIFTYIWLLRNDKPTSHRSAALWRRGSCVWRITDFPRIREVLTLRGLVTYYVLFFIHLESRKVEIAGITRHPDEGWMKQIARNLTMDSWGFLEHCRYLLHDRDTKYTRSFRAIIECGLVKTLPLPARSPNLNAHAERWVRSVKEECLSRLILFGEASLRRALSEFTMHYHAERNHQGKGNVLLFPVTTDSRHVGPVQCREWLGGLLRYYHRQAA
jgi:type I restriction-modification system DNA methylase subunit